jgi:hypothetical protein
MAKASRSMHLVGVVEFYTTVPPVVGDGYVRGEGIAAIIVQRASKASRIYATVVHAKSNTDGHKEQGLHDTHILLLDVV